MSSSAKVAETEKQFSNSNVHRAK